ncbi:hypothetical protein [Streptomyces yangpuensis]|uniref:hypothetical protein n=1 Tax=Streptomyces yangpuensis TaxID=1648182 RepID=UPI003803EE10
MAAHRRLHTLTAGLTAAALAAAVLVAWRRAARAKQGTHGADAAKAPWRRTAPPPDSTDHAPDRVAELHTSFLDPSLREASAHLEQYWNKLTSLYPHDYSERPRR